MFVLGNLPEYVDESIIGRRTDNVAQNWNVFFIEVRRVIAEDLPLFLFINSVWIGRVLFFR